MLNDHDIHILDVFGLIDDPDVGLLNGHDANRIHLELNMMLMELQSLPPAVATDYCSAMIRSTHCDFYAMRRRISKELRVIDAVQGVPPSGREVEGDLLRAIQTQTDRIERLLSRDGQDEGDERLVVSSGGVDPTAYYDYREVAALLGVSESTIYRLKAGGRLQAVEIGRRVRFLGEHILSLRDDGRPAVRVLDIGSS